MSYTRADEPQQWLVMLKDALEVASVQAQPYIGDGPSEQQFKEVDI